METKEKNQTPAEQLAKEPNAFAFKFFNDIFSSLSEGEKRQEDMRKRFEERRKQLGYTSTK